MNKLLNKHTNEELINIEEIPVIRFYPKEYEGKLPTIIFYHGWSSNKESQRLRAYILASLGYQVIIPDAINHGERGKVEYLNPLSGIMYFWPTILNNIEESFMIIDYIIDNLDGDINRIGVTGNSMGGITSSGILVADKRVKCGVVMNGSCNWLETNKIFKDLLGIEEDDMVKKLEDKLSILDPFNNMEKIKDKHILLLHGEIDKVVNINPQKEFYETIKMKYRDEDRTEMIVYENINHSVTTNMMGEMINWFNKYL